MEPGQPRRGASLGIGYWCCWTSIAVVVTGTVLVWIGTGREDLAEP